MFGDRWPAAPCVRQGQAWTLNEAEEIDLALPRKSAAFVSKQILGSMTVEQHASRFLNSSSASEACGFTTRRSCGV